jgi:hypothetical protein
MRWSVAPMFAALSRLLYALETSNTAGEPVGGRDVVSTDR